MFIRRRRAARNVSDAPTAALAAKTVNPHADAVAAAENPGINNMTKRPAVIRRAFMF